MNCQAAHELMLEADPEELLAGANGRLAGHLRQCAECRATAEGVLDGMSALDAELATGPPGSVDAALAGLRRRRRASQRRILPWAAAAAAILAAVLVAGPWNHEPQLSEFEPAVGLAAPPPVVEDVGGASMAMFATSNPRITVVWIYEESTR
jgi:predicted anti-sigma-YlaC factor YlaD